MANERIVFLLATHSGDVAMSIPEMQSIEAFRYAELDGQIQWKPERPWLERMEIAVDGISPAPTAIEALWEGDTYGWFVILRAVGPAEEGSPADRTVALGTYQGRGGDSRLFTGEVPPWPEREWATEDGEHLAARAGVPFRFVGGEGPTE